MQKGDCFLCPGEKERTLYYITEITRNRCKALSIYINHNTVQAMDWIREYDIILPKDIRMMPSSMYETIKKLMLECMEDMHKILQKEALRVDFDIEIGKLYTERGAIHRIIELKEDKFGHSKWHYKLFRIDRENISMNWGGSSPSESYKNHILPITENTLLKIQSRFKLLLATIDQYLEQ